MYNSNSAALDIDDAKSHTQTRLLLSRSRITHLDHPLSLVKTSIWNQFFPILGFFCAGVVLNQFGLIRNLTDVKALSEWGILFLLFEMGLELSLARLKALAKYAFGMGLAQLMKYVCSFPVYPEVEARNSISLPSICPIQGPNHAAVIACATSSHSIGDADVM
ncbi:hypothetical protein GYH30_027642 [Glycine max]|nr:hypothetical protein GYH30_027642 [Glycine max]